MQNIDNTTDRHMVVLDEILFHIRAIGKKDIVQNMLAVHVNDPSSPGESLDLQEQGQWGLNL